MSDVLSFAEIDGQHVELLPARTVLSSYCGYHSYYCGHYDYDYYSYSNDQAASAEVNQSIYNYGGVVITSPEANAINKA